MKRWYQITCVVKLAHPLSVSDMSNSKGDEQAANGYVVSIGICAEDIVQAASAAHNIALNSRGLIHRGDIVEEMQIQQMDELLIKQQLETEGIDIGGWKFRRSGLAYFNE
jgi:hypothetical protein